MPESDCRILRAAAWQHAPGQVALNSPSPFGSVLYRVAPAIITFSHYKRSPSFPQSTVTDVPRLKKAETRPGVG